MSWLHGYDDQHGNCCCGAEWVYHLTPETGWGCAQDGPEQLCCDGDREGGHDRDCDYFAEWAERERAYRRRYHIRQEP